ncbi:GL24981 [Drosophila persimilis]|uniref:GL24981 n=1 Tax=Drosophila persimilis TaxID=7234 RepID=B4GRA9_DROPE|nr:GL24981 [Drosophila persimilis]
MGIGLARPLPKATKGLKPSKLLLQKSRRACAENCQKRSPVTTEAHTAQSSELRAQNWFPIAMIAVWLAGWMDGCMDLLLAVFESRLRDAMQPCYLDADGPRVQ